MTPLTRPQTLATRRELDALLAAYRRAARRDEAAGRARLITLGRAVGAICGVAHCQMTTLVGARDTGPRFCAAHAPDDVAIERAMTGDVSVTLWPHERVEAVRRLARHHSDSVIANRLGLAVRSVDRIRRANDIPPAIPSTAPRRKDLAS